MKIGVKKPDLILLDYMIPVCDGKQTLQMIRSQFETSKIPVIMLTSLTEKDRVLQCFELGISGYLVKPVSKDDLMQAVNSVFK
jgi:CheY-like chemotaxis protein